MGYADCWLVDYCMVLRARRSQCTGGEKMSGLVTLNRFLWISSECWRHQSDCSTFNNCLYHPYWSHDQYSV